MPDNDETAYDLLLRLHGKDLTVGSMLESMNINMQPGKVYELVGDIGTGKTQVCYSITASELHRSPECSVVWIGAKTLRTEHLLCHLKNENDLDRVVCATAIDDKELDDIVTKLQGKLSKMDVSLVIVEDIATILHDVTWSNARERIRRQKEIIKSFQQLIADDVVLLTTNHTTVKEHAVPMMGEYWLQALLKTRMLIHVDEENPNVRVLAVRNEDGSASCSRFKISNTGLVEA